MLSTTNACDAAMLDPHESKFKKYGDLLIKDLENMENQEKPPFHWYQIQAVLQTKELIRRDDSTANEGNTTVNLSKPAIIVAPTGAGKSGIIVMLPYALKSKRVLVLTPSKVISGQLKADFGPKGFLYKTGYQTDERKLDNFLEPVTSITKADDVIAPGCVANLVIVNAQKFGGKAGTSLVHNNQEIVRDVESFFAYFDTLIVDEAHHYPAKTWKRIVDEFRKRRGDGQAKRIVFLTATPYRTNTSGEKTYIWQILGEGKERIAMEITQNMVEGITTRACKFEEFNKKPSNDELAEDLISILEGHSKKENRFVPQAMILVRTQKEAKERAEELNKIVGNMNFAVAILGNDSIKRRRLSGEKAPLEKFTAGDYRVAVTCGVALEGYDNSRVTLCVILRKIVSGRILFTQFVGRCKRMYRNLDGGEMDRTVATVLNYCRFGQKAMWDEMDEIAEDDPVEIEEEIYDDEEMIQN